MERFDFEKNKDKILAKKYKELEEKDKIEFAKYLEKEEERQQEFKRKKIKNNSREIFTKNTKRNNKETFTKNIKYNNDYLKEKKPSIELPNGFYVNENNQIISKKHNQSIGKIEEYKQSEFIVVIFFEEAKKMRCLTKMNQLVTKGIKIAFI